MPPPVRALQGGCACTEEARGDGEREGEGEGGREGGRERIVAEVQLLCATDVCRRQDWVPGSRAAGHGPRPVLTRMPLARGRCPSAAARPSPYQFRRVSQTAPAHPRGPVVPDSRAAVTALLRIAADWASLPLCISNGGSSRPQPAAAGWDLLAGKNPVISAGAAPDTSAAGLVSRCRHDPGAERVTVRPSKIR